MLLELFPFVILNCIYMLTCPKHRANMILFCNIEQLFIHLEFEIKGMLPMRFANQVNKPVRKHDFVYKFCNSQGTHMNI